MAQKSTTDSAILITDALLALREAARARHELCQGTPEYAAAAAVDRFRIAEVWRLAEMPK
jgi:hypothetical protein